MNTNCLSDRDLILMHYGEAPDGAAPTAAATHVSACADCRARLERLTADLARIPVIAEPEPAATSRVAARVTERLNRGYPLRWLPALGGAAVAAVALVITFAARSPQLGTEQPGLPAAPSIVSTSLEEEMPDIDFFEDLELIEDLELLQQIEGV